jgi:crotonobetainyl-CoA:carnitine CoA-transferase CaiB-like acyl-CoA transferase
MANRPLRKLLVVALEQAVAAPLCTVRLADAGARIIKIERREGETARHYDGTVFGESAYFTWLNRGKESAVLDIKQVEDLGLLRRMIARADVFVQNLAPGAAARLGLAAHQLTAEHRRLIAVDIVGYGQDTPYRDMRAYDLLVQAEAAACSITGTPAEPCKVGFSVADIVTGMNAHCLILEALLERADTGRGRAIEVSMFDGMADMMAVPLLHYTSAGCDTPRCGLAHASIRPYGAYRCRDGRELVVAIQNANEWKRFCDGVLESPQFVSDRRFESNPSRVLNQVALDAAIAATFDQFDSEQMVTRLQKSKIAWGRVSTVQDLAVHPALHWLSVELPSGDRVAVPRPAGRAEELGGAIPALGFHTEQVRSEFGERLPVAY